MAERLRHKKSTLYFSILFFVASVWLSPGCEKIPLNRPETSEQLNSENSEPHNLTSIVVTPLLSKSRNAARKCLGTTAAEYITVKDGGKLKHCGHQMIIPPGALSKDQKMYISVDRNNAAIADFGPDQTFNTFVEITISYADAILDNGDEKELTVAWFDKTSSKWVVVPSNVDIKNKMVTAKTNHFTQYTLSFR